MEDSNGQGEESFNDQPRSKTIQGDFTDYLISALSNSLGKKSKPNYRQLVRVDEIRSLRFESWWVEAGTKNPITVIYRLDGQPHEIVIQQTKYYIKELFSADKKKSEPLMVRSFLG